jgi:hypothetical protein
MAASPRLLSALARGTARFDSLLARGTARFDAKLQLVRLLTASLLFVVFRGVVFPGLAHAYCTPADRALLWSYPADGASDVPVDATFWLRLSRSGSVTVALDGALQTFTGVDSLAPEIDPGRILQIAPAALEANREYVLSVAYGAEQTRPVGPADNSDGGTELAADAGSDAPPPSHSFEIRFRTGSGRAPAALPTVVQGADVKFAGEQPRTEEPACRTLLEAQGCFDTGLLKTVTLDVAPGDALAWLVLGPSSDDSQLWPAKCGAPLLYFAGDLTEIFGVVGLLPKCYEVRAVQAGGVLGEAATFCTDSSANSASDASAAAAASDAGAGATDAAAPAHDASDDGGSSNASMSGKPKRRDDGGCRLSSDPRAQSYWLLSLLALLAVRSKRAVPRAS